MQESKSTKNLYFDIQLQTGKDETQSVRVMVQRGESSKRQLFLNKLQTQQPIKLSNLQVTPSNMVFLNKGTAIQDAPSHSLQFPFQPLASKTSNICGIQFSKPTTMEILLFLGALSGLGNH